MSGTKREERLGGQGRDSWDDVLRLASRTAAVHGISTHEDNVHAYLTTGSMMYPGNVSGNDGPFIWSLSRTRTSALFDHISGVTDLSYEPEDTRRATHTHGVTAKGRGSRVCVTDFCFFLGKEVPLKSPYRDRRCSN